MTESNMMYSSKYYYYYMYYIYHYQAITSYFHRVNSNDESKHRYFSLFSCVLRRTFHLSDSIYCAYQKCGKSFANRWFLQRHVDGVHLQLKRFRCSVCEARFSSKQGLAKHLKKLQEKRRHCIFKLKIKHGLSYPCYC